MISSVVVIAAILAAGALPVLWWGRRRAGPSRIIVGGLAALMLAGAILGFGLSLWALTATDDSQLARALVWGDSDVNDRDRFPSRAIGAAPDPVVFRTVTGSPVDGFAVGGSEALSDFLAATSTTAFIVIHGDDLLYEGYFNGSSRESTQTSFSVAKSFTSTLVGIAIDEGFVTGLDDPVTAYVPELLQRDARFGDITLRHLLTMSSGLEFREGASPWADPAATYYGTDLRSASVTKTSIAGSPGAEFHYNDWNVILLGLVLERTTGMSVSAYMETRLWQPMGAEGDGSWSLDSSGSGFEKVFVGVNGRAIDFAKLGWLYLHGGRIGDRQIVPADFIEAATRVDTTTDPAPDYQYLWWVDADREAYFAHGDHGQVIYVQPRTELVVVRHGRTGDSDWVAFAGDLVDWLGPRIDAG